MIDEASRKKLADGIDILISMQRKFQTEHGFDFWRQSSGKRREMFIRTLFAAMSELAEAGDEVNKWWKKGSKEPESLDIKRKEIMEEMIDSLHFFLSCLLILRADGNEVADTYLRKLGVNFDRQRDGKLGYV
ncbi:MAG: dUTP diphosphatase [Candidatus Aenigmarchaeota archaeon]|nr:dUTP diphosphatase [Candidatus Aenigmarchaeota archaeon]